jgi:hypothetical protein
VFPAFTPGKPGANADAELVIAVRTNSIESAANAKAILFLRVHSSIIPVYT